MDKKNTNQATPTAQEIEKKVGAAVKDALDVLGQQSGSLAKSIEAFGQHQKEVRERIDRGARRTSGRIV